MAAVTVPSESIVGLSQQLDDGLATDVAKWVLAASQRGCDGLTGASE